MAKKLTIKEQYNMVIEALVEAGREDLVPFIEGRVAVQDKKATSKKPTEQQVANAQLKADIVAHLTENGARVRAGELAKTFDTSTTRVSALLKQLVDSGEVKREVEKKVAYFSIP